MQCHKEGGEKGKEFYMAESNAAVDLSFFDKPRNEGRIANKRGTKKLYFDFFYHGVRIEKSTGLDDTPKNRYEAGQMLAAILEMKKPGSLDFAKIFPRASEEEKAFHAKLEQREYAPDAQGVTFSAYVTEWYKEIWPTYESHSGRTTRARLTTGLCRISER